MKTFITNFVIFLVLFFFSSLAQTDPNNDPNWDWQADIAWTLYTTSFPVGTGISPNNPFYQNGIGAAVYDNKPEDGWVLVQRDFGTPTRQVQPTPFLTLYNKYQGLLRVFVYLEMNEGYETGTVRVSGDDAYEKTVCLTFLSNISWGRNDFDKVKDRNGAAATPILDGSWAFADFPITYDPTISGKIDSRLQFKIRGIQNFNITINGLGTMNQVFGDNQPGNISDVGFFQTGGTFNSLGKKVFGTQETWLKWQNIIKNIGQTIPANTTSPSLLNLRDWAINVFGSWTTSNLGLIGAGVGFIDFLITGGRLTKKEQPAPMNYLLNFRLTGTMDTDDLVGAVTLPLPGASHAVQYATNLLYTQPLGTLNLQVSPILEHRIYWWPQGGGSNLETHTYRVKDDLLFDLNPSSDLEISNIEAAFVFELTAGSWPETFLGYADQGFSPIDGRPIELESYNNEKYAFRTSFVNANVFKHQSITLPSGFSLYIKIKAELKVKNSPPGQQPVIFIATYDANVEEVGGNTPWPFTVSNVFGSGWRTASVPLGLTDYSRYAVFPSIPSSNDIFAYTPGIGYVPKTELSNGPGYFAKFPAENTVTITGSPITTLAIPVSTGWNLIGNISYDLPRPTVCSDPPGIITGMMYTYQLLTGGYAFVTDNNKLFPGLGYWIKTTAPGNIILEVGAEPCGLAKTNSDPGIDLTKMDKFIIIDAAGYSQNLYVSNIDMDTVLVNTSIDLPPILPEIEFDSRFDYNEFIKRVSADSGTIDMDIFVRTNNYPVSLSWEINPANGINYSFIGDSSTGKISNIKTTKGNISFDNLVNNKIELFASTDISNESDNFPKKYTLQQNFPNPFNPSTTIKYSLAEAGNVELVVYDILGRKVKELVNQTQQAGRYNIHFDASSLASGIYIYLLRANEFVDTKKMILLK